MARLPRYQESGLISADVPRFDFANVREQNIASQGLMQSLDRLAQFAFGKAREEKEQRNQLVGIQMRSEYELEIQSELSKISDEIDRDEITDPIVASDRIKALTTYVNDLANTSPQQATALMGSVTAGGKAILGKLSDKAAANYAVELDQRVAKAVRDTSKNLQDVYMLYGKGQINAEEVLQYEVGIQSVVEGTARQSVKAREKYLGEKGEFVKAKRLARSAAMTNYLAGTDFAADEISALSKINSNDFGVMSELAVTFTPEEIKEVKEDVIKRFVENSEAMKRQQAQRRAAKDLEFVDSYKIYVDPKSSSDQRAQARTRMMQSADTAEEVDRVINGPKATTDPLLFSQLRDRVYRNQITDIRQLWNYSNVLTKEDMSRLQTEFMSADKEILGRIRGDIRRWAGVPENITNIFNPKAGEFVREQAVNDAFDRLVAQERKKRENLPSEKITPIDYEALKDRALADFEKTNRADDKRNQARAKLDGYTEEKRLKNRIDQNTSIEDLRRTRKFSPQELEDIKSAQDALRSQR